MRNGLFAIQLSFLILLSMGISHSVRASSPAQSNISPITISSEHMTSLKSNVTHRLVDIDNVTTSKKLEIPSSSSPSEVKIDEVRLKQSYLMNNSTFWPYSNTSSDYSYKIDNGKMYMNYSAGIVARFDQSLNIGLSNPDDAFVFRMQELNFNYSEDEFAFLELELQLQIDGYDFFYLFFLASSNYSQGIFADSYSPSTERYIQVQPMTRYTLNYSYITQDVGMVDTIYVKNIAFFGYRPSGLNVSLITSELMISQSRDPRSLDTRLFQGSEFTLLPGEHVFLDVDSTCQLSLSYSRTRSEKILISFIPEIEYNGVRIMAEIDLNYSQSSYSYLDFPQSSLFSNISINAIPSISPVDLSQFSTHLEISGMLPIISADFGQQIIQNESYSLTNTYNLSSASLFSQTRDKIAVILAKDIRFSVPLDWSNGTSKLVGYNTSGVGFIYEGSTPDAPATISAIGDFRISPFYSLSIPYEYIADSEPRSPKVSIVGYDDFTFNSTQITFPAGSLAVGKHSLLIIFTLQGFHTVTVRVSITVSDPELEWTVYTLQRAENYTFISVEIPTIAQIELPVYIESSTIGKIQIFSSVTKIFIETNTNELRLTLSIGEYDYNRTILLPDPINFRSQITLTQNITFTQLKVIKETSLSSDTLVIGLVGALGLSSLLAVALKFVRKDSAMIVG